MYVVKITDVLKGALKQGENVRIAIPQGVDIAQKASLGDTLLFLKRPEIPQNKNAGQQQVFIVVSGRFGAVPATYPMRIEGVRDYLSARSVRAGEDLTSAISPGPNSTSGEDDRFLQKSAIADLYKHRDDKRAVEQLTDAARSDSIPPAVTRSAVKALEMSSSSLAIPSLAKIAEDSKARRIARETAVEAVTNMPAGAEHARRWAKADDEVLSSAARASIRRAGLPE